MNRYWHCFVGVLVLASLSPHSALGSGLGGEQTSKKYQEYRSKFKKRGDVHGLVFQLPASTVYDGAIEAFRSLELTVNTENRQLGFIEGGRSRGMAGEIVRVWVDPEDKQGHRVEVRNVRLSRMGLIGFTATKDWSASFLDEISRILAEVPTLTQLEEAVESEPDSLEAHRQLIAGYLATNEPEKALSEYEKLLEKHPASSLDRTKYVELLVEMGETDQAIEVLKDAAQSDPDLAYSLARIYAQTGEAAAAVRILKQLCEENPDDLKAKYDLARASFLAGDLESAKTLFESVIELAPDHPFAAGSKVWVKLASSVPALDTTDPKMALSIGEQLKEEGLDLLAGRYLENAATSLPAGSDRYRALRVLSEIYLHQEDFSAVIGLLEPLVAELKKQKQGELLFTLSLAHCGQRNFGQAFECANMSAKAKHRPAKELRDILKNYI